MLQGFNFEMLGDVVRSVTKKNEHKLQPLLAKEDIEQELWEKLIKVFKTDKDFRFLPPEEQIKSARTILNNRIIDLGRKKVRSIDPVTDHCELNAQFEEVICNGGSPGSGGGSTSAFFFGSTPESADSFVNLMDRISTHFQAAESGVMYQELNGLISGWILEQEEPIKTLITEKLAPSTSTMKKWTDLCDRYPRYKGYESIPGITLCLLLGMDKSLWYKTIRALRSYLTDQGYALT